MATLEISLLTSNWQKRKELLDATKIKNFGKMILNAQNELQLKLTIKFNGK